MNDEIVKVRLKRTHYLNGFKKQPGSVIRVSKLTASWLVEKGVAIIISR